jgi:hypothetical protein
MKTSITDEVFTNVQKQRKTAEEPEPQQEPPPPEGPH